ncbi:MAG: PQQ-binding-like beta-propeller repeat protein [Candidatus Bathyarchaeia archaeon]
MVGKNCISLLATILIISLLLATSSIVFAQTINYNPDSDTLVGTVPSYMSSDNSAYSVASEYGNLLNEDYAWYDPHGNNPERTGFNPGPAPDRPDVVFRTDTGLSIPKVYLGGSIASDVSAAFVNTFDSGGPMAMGGQLILQGSIRVNAQNTTTRSAVISLSPHTGTVNWASIINYGPTAGVGTSTAHAGTRYIFKVDDTHFALLSTSAGLAMFDTTGRFLWRDTTIVASAVYHAAVVAPAPVSMIFGPRSISGQLVPSMSGWDLSDPSQDKGTGNRNVWNYVIDEPGTSSAGRGVLLCYGDGLVFMGSYSSCAVYALDATTGEKVWETYVADYVGYMSTYAYGKLYIGCQSMHIYALDGETGEIVWHNTDGLANRAFNVWNLNAAYGRVYLHDLGFGRTGAQKCLDAETGEMLWASTELNSIGYYQTVVGDGKVFGNQADGSTTTGREADATNFACWDALTGETIWNINIAANVPILAYGCLYFVVSSQLWCISTALQPVDWGVFRGNVDTPGFTLSKGPVDISTGPKWAFVSGAAILSSPTVSDGKVYFNSNDGLTYCLDAYDGSLIWTHAETSSQMTTFGSSPAVSGGMVYVGPDDGYFYVLDADDGTELKKVTMGTYRSVHIVLGQHNIASSPIISGGRVYVGSMHNGLFYCLDLNGNVQWSVDVTGTGDPIVGSAAVSNGFVYVMGWDGSISKIDMNGNVALNFATIRTGSSFWSSFWQPPSYTPTVSGDRLWIGGTNNLIRAYNVTDGSVLSAGEQPNVAGENSHGGAVYVPDWAMTEVRNATGYNFGNTGGKVITQAGPTMVCASASDGSNLWSSWGGWEVWSTPVFSGIGASAVVYYGSDSYGLQVLNASNGIPLSWYTTGGNIAGSPAIWDGKLYVGTYDNMLYCFEDHPVECMSTSIAVDKTVMSVGDSLTVTTQLTMTPSVNVYEEIGRSAPIPGLPDTEVLVTLTAPDGEETELTVTTDNYGWATVIHTLNTVGTWKVIAWYMGEDKATFSRSYAFSDELTITVSEGAAPPASTLVATVSPATSSFTVGESVVLTASTSGGTPSFAYQWYQTISGQGVALSGETSSTFLVAPHTEGTYGYYCQVTDSGGQVDSSDTAEIKVNAEATGLPMEYIYAVVAVIAIIIVAIVAYMVLKKRK